MNCESRDFSGKYPTCYHEDNTSVHDYCKKECCPISIDCTCGFDKPTCERCFGQGEIAGHDMKLYKCPDCSDPITTKE